MNTSNFQNNLTSREIDNNLQHNVIPRMTNCRSLTKKGLLLCKVQGSIAQIEKPNFLYVQELPKCYDNVHYNISQQNKFHHSN